MIIYIDYTDLQQIHRDTTWFQTAAAAIQGKGLKERNGNRVWMEFCYPWGEEREALVSMEISWDIRKAIGDLFCQAVFFPNFETS